MTTKWLRVKLAEITTPIERSEEPIPGKIYRQIGVKLWGEGANVSRLMAHRLNMASSSRRRLTILF